MQDYHYKHRLKVRFSEVDASGIVFHAHYLNYLDMAVNEYFSEGLKLDRYELSRSEQFSYIVKKVNLEFNAPATLNDWLNIWCKTVGIGKTNFVMRFLITRDGEEKALLKAENIYVSYNHIQKIKLPVPDFVRQAIEMFEHGGLES